GGQGWGAGEARARFVRAHTATTLIDRTRQAVRGAGGEVQRVRDRAADRRRARCLATLAGVGTGHRIVVTAEHVGARRPGGAGVGRTEIGVVAVGDGHTLGDV